LKTKLELILPSKIEAIPPAVKQIMRLLRKECCAPEHEFAVETALHEALANAILHGNRQDPNKKVYVCCACDSAKGVLIVVQDEGKGFDPAKVPSPLLAENIHSEGGRGIFLINALMDEVHLRRGGTEIYMRKGGAVSH
jgi:serine/threonine-protein kinase RsbW